MSALGKLQEWIRDNPERPGRWPGVAVRISSGTRAGEIDFRHGRVEKVTDLSITIETDHPLYKYVKLMGASYFHHCDHCRNSIPGHVTYQRPADTIMHNGFEIPIRFFCPYCGPDHPLRMIRPGERVRLHYRYERDGGSGQWFAEVQE